MNLTVNWDAVKDTPVLFGKALEAVGNLLPPGGGEYDLKVRWPLHTGYFASVS